MTFDPLKRIKTQKIKFVPDQQVFIVDYINTVERY